VGVQNGVAPSVGTESILNTSSLSFLLKHSFNCQFVSQNAAVTLLLFLNHPPFYSFLP
jgi:hypothetical protein